MVFRSGTNRDIGLIHKVTKSRLLSSVFLSVLHFFGTFLYIESPAFQPGQAQAEQELRFTLLEIVVFGCLAQFVAFLTGFTVTGILLIAELFIYFKYKSACGGLTAKCHKAQRIRF